MPSATFTVARPASETSLPKSQESDKGVPGRRAPRRAKARPIADRRLGHYRVREERVSKAGNVTVRYLSRLRYLGLGRAHTGQQMKLLIADDYVRVLDADGSLLRELVLDPAATTSRAYTRPR